MLYIKNLVILAILVATVAEPLLAQRVRNSGGRDRSRATSARRVAAPRVPRPRVIPYQPRYSSRRSYGTTRRYNNRGYRSYGYGGYGVYGGVGIVGGGPSMYPPMPQRSGLKFDLELVRGEGERKTVRRGRVFVNDIDRGLVGRYDGVLNKPLEFAPGTYDVQVHLSDGRVFANRYEVRPEEITPVYPTFDEKDK